MLELRRACETLEIALPSHLIVILVLLDGLDIRLLAGRSVLCILLAALSVLVLR